MPSLSVMVPLGMERSSAQGSWDSSCVTGVPQEGLELISFPPPPPPSLPPLVDSDAQGGSVP
jgi:hypothetical protein